MLHIKAEVSGEMSHLRSTSSVQKAVTHKSHFLLFILKFIFLVVLLAIEKDGELVFLQPVARTSIKMKKKIKKKKKNYLDIEPNNE